MKTAIALALVFSAALVPPAVFARDAAASNLVGVWRLASYQNEFRDGRPSVATLGEHAKGYLIFTPAGRMFGILEAQGRRSANSDHDSAELMLSMTAYTGTYTISGDQWVTNVSAAWNPAWDGSKQVREFHIEGDRLIVLSHWMLSPHIAGSPIVRARMVFQCDERIVAR